MDAAYFDRWYADMAVSTGHSDIQLGCLGLPPELESTSLLSWDGIDDVVDALALAPGDTFVDLACGRGGYGLEIARRTRSRIAGVDFSAVAIERARVRAFDDWADVGAEFRVGDLVATGLPDGCAAAVMCIDAMQFAQPYRDGLAECLRILAPGGRLALTGWAPKQPGDPDVPERLRRDIPAEVEAAGFIDIRPQPKPQWQQAERAMWRAAVAADPSGDPALQSMHDEGVRTLPIIDRVDRLLVTARRRAPAPADL